jgi:hypothetical protein
MNSTSSKGAVSHSKPNAKHFSNFFEILGFSRTAFSKQGKHELAETAGKSWISDPLCSDFLSDGGRLLGFDVHGSAHIQRNVSVTLLFSCAAA